MKLKSLLALATALTMNAWAQDKPGHKIPDHPKESKEAKETKPTPPPKPALPETSEAKGKLNGGWLLQGSSLGKSLATSLQKSAGTEIKFNLGELTGDYVATVDLKEKKIVIEWHKWKMESTARSERAGEFKMTVKVSGRQEYQIKSITDGKTPDARKLDLQLMNDFTTSKTTFRGIEIKSKVQLPELQSGHWSIHEGHLYLEAKGEPWKFDRKEAE